MQLFKAVIRSRIAARAVRALASDSGNAIAELALGISFLLAPMLFGAAEFGFLVYDSIEVANASHAAALYASRNSTSAADASGIQQIAQMEAGDFGSGMTVSSSYYWACSQNMTGSQYTTQSAAENACPANAQNHNLLFVKVTATAPFASPVRIPGMPASWNLTSSSVMEVLK